MLWIFELNWGICGIYFSGWLWRYLNGLFVSCHVNFLSEICFLMDVEIIYTKRLNLFQNDWNKEINCVCNKDCIRVWNFVIWTTVKQNIFILLLLWKRLAALHNNFSQILLCNTLKIVSSIDSLKFGFFWVRLVWFFSSCIQLFLIQFMKRSQRVYAKNIFLKKMFLNEAESDLELLSLKKCHYLGKCHLIL